MARRAGPNARRLVVVGALALAGLLAVRDRLDGPPLPTSLATAARWLEPNEPVAVAARLLWLLAMAAAAYLTIVAGLVLLGATTGRPAPARWAERLSLPVVRRLTGRAIGVGLTASVAVTASPVAAGPTEPAPPTSADDEPVTMVLLDREPPPTAEDSVATMRRLDDDEPASDITAPDTAPPTVGAPATTSPTAPHATATPTTAPDAAVAPGAPPGADHEDPSATAPGPATTDVGPAPPPETWTIAPGEHLWRVAAETLAAHGRADDDRATLAYLHRVIEANRDRLIDPDNPDLVHPGQVMVLPPTDA
jgi:hypothetical protein